MKFRKCAIAVAVLVLVAAICGLCGCGQSVSVEDAGKVLSETEEEITIVDQAGREVTVEKYPETIALSYRVAVRPLLSLGLGDRITGIGKSEEFLERLQPSLKDAACVGMGVVDIEALAELGPELFIHKASDTDGLEAATDLGIAAIGISVETPEEMMVALELLGKVCGAEDKAEELIAYYNNELEEIKGLTEKADKAYTAVVMGSSIGKVADGSMLQGEMLELAGASNCAADLEASELWPQAGAEQIFAWNPQYIFISGSQDADYCPEDLYDEDSWSEMAAVKDRHIYVIPSELDSWEFPGVSTVLGVYYMMNTMYPDLVDDEMLEQKVEEFYQMAYGCSFSRQELGY